MNEAFANSSDLSGLKKSDARWSRNRWLVAIAIVFVVHVVLIFLFGEKKLAAVRPATNIPRLILANNSDELIALNDPTLFALPGTKDFSSARWSKISEAKKPSFRWTEPPRWLALNVDNLGAAFGPLMPMNLFDGVRPDYKPTIALSKPRVSIEADFPQNSSMQIEGELAQRAMAGETFLTNWPYADVIAPSKIQVLVDAAGTVVSAILLPSENGIGAVDHLDAADQYAIAIARTLRFKPSREETLGRVNFNWHTVPPETAP